MVVAAPPGAGAGSGAGSGCWPLLFLASLLPSLAWWQLTDLFTLGRGTDTGEVVFPSPGLATSHL